MSDGNQNRGTARKPNALSEYKLRLIGDPVNGAKRKPTLGFSFHKNQPQIDVRTNVDGDKDYGRISAKLDTPTFFAIVPAIENMCDPATPNNTKIVVKNLAVRFVNGQRTDPKLDTQLLVGKDAEGLIYMAVTSWERERPIIKFVFRPSEMHTLFDGTGTELSPQAVSLLYAKGWARLFAAMAPFVLYHEYVEPPPRDGGNGGGNNNNGGNRGGGNWGGGNNGGNRNSGNSGGADAGGGDDWPM